MTQRPEATENNPTSSANRQRVPRPTNLPVMQYMERFAGTLSRIRDGMTPAWARDFPQLRFPQQPDRNYQLISAEKLKEVFDSMNASVETRARIQADLQHMDYNLLRLFKDRDYEAKYHQNRYRLYQIMYIVLALSATIIASLQAMFQANDHNVATVLAGLAGFVALAASAIAYIGDRRPSFMLWMEERRSAEHLRREYYRYLLNLPPYTTLSPIERKLKLASRAAQISGGTYNRPEDEITDGAG